MKHCSFFDFCSSNDSFRILLSEWDYELNGDIPKELGKSSHKKVSWKCKNGHQWVAAIYSRTSGNGCPYCSGRKTISGLNDLATINPALALEWHPTKNHPLKPSSISPKSNKNVWWSCNLGHEWKTTVLHRTSGESCPYCTGYKVWRGFNDLSTTHPDLSSEWHPTKNYPLLPSDISAGSSKKVWWICKLGHSYESSIANRSKGRGCPYCSGRKVLIGYNDLKTTDPDIAKEWHPRKNNALYPENFSAGSHKKIWWICDKGHEWEATIYNRVRVSGCPICAGKTLLPGVNDLQSQYPDVAQTWCFEKNNNLSPSQVFAHSGKSFWWECSIGHRWKSKVSNRTNGRGCPICNNEFQSSFPEQAIFYYIQKKYPDAISRYNSQNKKEIDIYIPSKKLGIEHDGPFHKRKTSEDFQKDEYYKSKGITIFRLKQYERIDGKNYEYSIPEPNNSEQIIWYPENELQIGITNLFSKIYYYTHDKTWSNFDINIERDRISIQEQYILLKKQNSLAKLSPNIAKEWHPTKNGNLFPENIANQSNYAVWWMCQKGHEWKQKINQRTARQLSCPYCSDTKLIRGYNDLATRNPQLASEWNNKQNGSYSPRDFKSRSSRNVWWQCTKGHEWKARIADRMRGNGCPYCKGRANWDNPKSGSIYEKQQIELGRISNSD